MSVTRPPAPGARLVLLACILVAATATAAPERIGDRADFIATGDDGSVVTFADTDSVSVYDVRDHALRFRVPLNGATIRALTLNSFSHTLVWADATAHTHFVNIESGDETQVMPISNGDVRSIALNGPGSMIAAGLADGGVAVLSLHDPEKAKAFSTNDGSIERVFWHSDLKHVTLLSAQRIVRDLDIITSSTRQLAILPASQRPEMFLTPDGSLRVTAMPNGHVEVCVEGKPPSDILLFQNRDEVASVSASSDQHWLVAAGVKSPPRLLDLRTGETRVGMHVEKIVRVLGNRGAWVGAGPDGVFIEQFNEATLGGELQAPPH